LVAEAVDHQLAGVIMQLKSQISQVSLVIAAGNGFVIVRETWRAELESGHSYEGCDMESVRSWALANTHDDDHENTRERFAAIIDLI
jgi:hypothetical protein